MPNWFRKKDSGYGWTPCSWEGWMATAVYTAGIVAVAVNTRMLGPAKTFVLVAALTAVLLAVILATSGKDSDG